MRIFFLFKNVRFYILVFSFSLSIAIYFYVTNFFPTSYQTIRITQIYALTAASFLYFALLAGPFTYNFKTPLNSLYIKARRAIGVSAFYFAFLHYLFGIFGIIGGIMAVFSLPAKYIFAISLSYTALTILLLMALTSFDFMIKFMTFKKWKFLHRFVYIAGIFILTHALLIGEHFQDISPISVTATILITFLAYLEGKRIIANIKTVFLQKKTTASGPPKT